MDAQLLSALVAVVAATVASVQVIVMRSTSQTELLREMVESLYDAEYWKARQSTYKLANKHHTDWTENERQLAEKVGAQFTRLAFLLKSRRSGTREFIDLYGSQYIRQWEVLGEYVESERTRTQQPLQWIYFEWLARESLRRQENRWTASPWRERPGWGRLRARTRQLDADQLTRRGRQQAVQPAP